MWILEDVEADPSVLCRVLEPPEFWYGCCPGLSFPGRESRYKGLQSVTRTQGKWFCKEIRLAPIGTFIINEV